jgi:hypothetical protein
VAAVPDGASETRVQRLDRVRRVHDLSELDGKLEAVTYLERNGWLDIGKLDGRTTVGLGERARKLLEEAAEAATLP